MYETPLYYFYYISAFEEMHCLLLMVGLLQVMLENCVQGNISLLYSQVEGFRNLKTAGI
jgi:hypothetical protein